MKKKYEAIAEERMNGNRKERLTKYAQPTYQYVAPKQE